MLVFISLPPYSSLSSHLIVSELNFATLCQRYKTLKFVLCIGITRLGGESQQSAVWRSPSELSRFLQTTDFKKLISQPPSSPTMCASSSVPVLKSPHVTDSTLEVTSHCSGCPVWPPWPCFCTEEKKGLLRQTVDEGRMKFSSDYNGNHLGNV